MPPPMRNEQSTSEVKRDVHDHVLLAADQSAPSHLDEKRPDVDTESLGRSLCVRKNEPDTPA